MGNYFLLRLEAPKISSQRTSRGALGHGKSSVRASTNRRRLDPLAPTCDSAHEAPQPPARLSSCVCAQAVTDEVHVLEAVTHLGLRKDGASGPPGWGGDVRAQGTEMGQVARGTTPGSSTA